MIQRAITAIIGVVIGLFATFAVFSAILGGLDSFYLLTQERLQLRLPELAQTGAARRAREPRASGRRRRD